MSDSLSTPWTVGGQAPLSMGFPRQGYWSGLPFPSPIKKLLLLLLGSAGSSLLCASSLQFWRVRTILHHGARDSHCMRWPKHWSFSFSIIPPKEHPELISFKMDWLDFLAIQGTFKSLLQHHSSKASVLRCSASPPLTSIHDY